MLQKITKYSILALAFLMPLFFLPFTVEPFELNKGYLLIVLTALGFFSWLAQMIFKEKKICLKVNLVDLAVLGFLALMLVNVLIAKNRTIGLWGDYGRFWPSLLGFLALGGFYFLVRNFAPQGASVNRTDKSNRTNQANRTDRTDGVSWTERVLQVFLASAGVVVLTTLLAMFGVWGLLNNQLDKTSEGLRLPLIVLSRGFNPASGSLAGLAVFLAFVCFLAVGFLAFAQKGKLKKALYALLIAGILLVLVLVDFWPSWLMLAVGLVCFLGFSFWQRTFKENINKLAPSVLLLAVCLVFLFSQPLRSFLPPDLLPSLPQEIILKQAASWRIAKESLAGNFITGAGLGNFSYVFSRFRTASFLAGPLWQLKINRAANFISEFFTTTGVLGLLAYAGLVFALLSLALRALKEQKRAPTIIILTVSLIVLIAGQFVYYQNIILAFSFWLVFALLAVSLGRSKEKAVSFNTLPEVGLVFSVVFWVVLVSFVFLGFNMVKAYLADVYYHAYLTNPSENLASLEKAASLASKRANLHIALASAYLADFRAEAGKENPDLQKVSSLVNLAVQESQKSILQGPEQADSQRIAGLVYKEIQGLAQGAADWAIKSFENALKIEPTDVQSMVDLAKLEQARGDIEKTRALLEKAKQIKPDFLEGRFELGRFYYNQGDYDKAEEEFLVCLQIFPNHSNSLYSLALIKERQGAQEAALALFKMVEQLNPDNEHIKQRIESLERKAPVQPRAEEEPGQESEAE